jgi:hypothetical protein
MSTKNTNYLKRTIMISNSEFEAFFGLDLDAVKIKLMHESGEGWSPARTSAVETEYRRFLYLAKAFPEEHKAPTEDVDTFWHYHILDTMKYAADCEHLFGHFLHHFPYAGMRGKADLQTLQQVGVRTAILYERTFGVRYPGRMVEATADASCGIAEQAGLRLEIKTTLQPNPVQAAYCFANVKVGGAGIVQAAYCFETVKAAGAGKVQAAYCFETVKAADAGKVQAAYCFENVQAARPGTVQPAYCFVPEHTAGARQDLCSERPTLVC